MSFPSRGVSGIRSYVSDKLLRRRLEYDDSLSDLEYPIDGGDEIDLLPEDMVDDSGDTDELNEEDEQEV